MPAPQPPVRILGVDVHPVTVEQLHGYIGEKIATGARAQVLNVNAHCLNLTWERRWMREMFRRADMVFCDGFGVLLAARILGSSLPERITYADWIWEFASFCERGGFTLFLLGARPGVAEAARSRLVERFPRLNVVGTHHGYFDKTLGSVENDAVIETINRARPDVVVVAFGMPLQERWLRDNWEALDAHVALTSGAALDYVAGRLRRPPRWMTEHGLEWIGRLAIEPQRLWKRYLVGNPLFLYRVVSQRLGLLREAPGP